MIGRTLTCLAVIFLELSLLSRAFGQELRACWNLTEYSVKDFGDDFMFGVASSATQVEGAAFTDGRSASIWDVFAQLPGKIDDSSNPTVSDDHYHHYLADVQLMKQLGVKSYRFSLSWSRIFPNGTGYINPLGVQFYLSLLQSLQQNGIEPAVTLYHWDLPNVIEEEYGGLLNESFADLFAKYADACFYLFGQYVKTWITFNEPGTTSIQGFGLGSMAPGRCSDRSQCTAGDSTTEPYIVGHNILVAHAVAVKIYRTKYQSIQQGRIGITLDSQYFYPADSSATNVSAANRGMEFSFGWFADPCIFGDYPSSMKLLVGSRLPEFTDDEKALLRGSADFLGLNFYTASWAWQGQPGPPGTPWQDNQVSTSSVSPVTGQLIGAPTASSWLYVVPDGIKEMLLWISSRYSPSVPILITENGCSDKGAPLLEEALCDMQRVGYYQDYLLNVLAALRAGVNVQGYFAWAVMDNWEWAHGYNERFGIIHVNFSDPARPRNFKASAWWWQAFLTSLQ